MDALSTTAFLSKSVYKNKESKEALLVKLTTKSSLT